MMDQVLGSNAVWIMILFSVIWLFLSPWIVTILWNSTITRLMAFEKTNYWLSFRLLFLILILSIGPWIMNFNFNFA